MTIESYKETANDAWYSRITQKNPKLKPYSNANQKVDVRQMDILTSIHKLELSQPFKT